MRLTYTAKKKDLRTEEYITGRLEVTVTEGYIIEGDESRELFYFAMAVISSTRTTVNTWFMTDLQ